MLYDANWESIDSRPVPEWFSDAKLGIFIHWGLYSVPAYTSPAEYAEWYAKQIENPDHPARLFHDRVYGRDFLYQDFVHLFRAELFDADEWATLFRRSGAKYINLVSKHHDGFCMYKTDYAWNWNSFDVGPHRDFCAELKEAVEAQGVRFGVYHSLYEWYHPLYQKDPERFALEHLIPMMKDLIERYQPATLFTDGEWDDSPETWHSTEFLAWLYNESSVRDFIVPNDRWGKGTRGVHGGNYTTEYGRIGERKNLDAENARPFEECRGLGSSFGFNRAENSENYLSAKELIELLCRLCSAGGNLLINIGPAADGTIPAIMQERLLQLGKWLETNGEAIYGTRKYSSEPQEGLYYTKKAGNVYAITSSFPFCELLLDKVPFRPGAKAELLGSSAPISVAEKGGKACLRLPCLNPDEIAGEHLYAFKLTGV